MLKKRKFISILLTISMMLTLFPFAAFAEEVVVEGTTETTTTQEQPAAPEVATQLPEAVNGVITLDNDVELSATHEFSENVTLKLNGHNITAKDKRALWVKAGALTIEGKGTITSVNATLTGKDAEKFLTSSVIRVGDSSEEKGAAKLVLGQDVTVEAPATYGVSVFGKNENLEAVINGTIHSVVAPTLAGSGTSGLTPTKLTLNEAANLSADDSIAIYHPQDGVLIINGATVRGTGGIEMKSGTLNVALGSKITATATETTHKKNGNGTSTDGYAIVTVDTNGGYVGKATVNVNGGSIEGPVDKLVDAVPASGKECNIVVSGGTFDCDVTEFLANGKGQAVDGTVGELNDGNAAAKMENQLYGCLDDAIKAAAASDKDVTVEVLKDATIPSAQYTIKNKITLKKSDSAQKMPKIDATVASGETTRGFCVMPGAGLTLDGVEMTIMGTKNTDPEKGNDGTGMDLYNSPDNNIKGANLTLTNKAVLNLKNLQRATIASCNGEVVNDSTVKLEPGTMMNITDIDGNGANGGIWTVDGATLTMENIADFGLSAQAIIVNNGGKVNASKVGFAGVTAKDIKIEKGSQVNVIQSGKKLPYESKWSGKTQDVVTLKKDGSMILDKDSSLVLKDNVGIGDKAVNTFGPGNGSVQMTGDFTGEVRYDAPAQGDYRVEYLVNGDVYYTVTVKKEHNGKVSYTAPKNPSLSGYTFRGWDYGGVTVEEIADNKVSFTPTAGKNVYQFKAEFSYNRPAVVEYTVNVSATDNGAVSVSPKRAERGDTVTITATPDKGYVVDAVVVTDRSGNKVTVSKKADGKYTFTMPKSSVTVKATFKEEPKEPATMPFIDVAKTAWYYPAVEYVYNNDLMNGTTDNIFAPNVSLNRAMMAAVLYNMEGGPQCDKDGLFSDVKDGKWYTDAINWAASNDIVSGMPDGTYAPDQALTREQMASILYRYAEYKGIDISARADLDKFTDGDCVSPWASDVVQWAVSEKLINGVGSELQPKGTASRAQVATVLMNFCENVAK